MVVSGRQWSSVVASGRQNAISGRQKSASGRQKHASGRQRSSVARACFFHKCLFYRTLKANRLRLRCSFRLSSSGFRSSIVKEHTPKKQAKA